MQLESSINLSSFALHAHYMIIGWTLQLFMIEAAFLKAYLGPLLCTKMMAMVFSSCCIKSSIPVCSFQGAATTGDWNDLDIFFHKSWLMFASGCEDETFTWKMARLTITELDKCSPMRCESESDHECTTTPLYIIEHNEQHRMFTESCVVLCTPKS